MAVTLAVTLQFYAHSNLRQKYLVLITRSEVASSVCLAGTIHLTSLSDFLVNRVLVSFEKRPHGLHSEPSRQSSA